MKYCTSPTGSFRDLFMQMSSILQQPVGMAKNWQCQNVLTASCTMRISVFIAADITNLGANADGIVRSKLL